MFDILEKIGEGNRGEVYKVKLEDGQIAALKYAKNYEIEKEWEILKFLNGFYAPKPIYKGKKYIIMEYIKGLPLKKLKKKEYYLALKEAIKGAFYLDEKGVFHKQLGRFYHILFDGKKVKFIDFERGVFSKKSRNFLQIVGYYLMRDESLDKERIKKEIKNYQINKNKAMKEIIKILDEKIIQF